MKKIIAVTLICASMSIIAAAQSFSIQGGVTAVAAGESTPEVRQQTFDIVWTTVKEKHFDPTFGGVDWLKVREQYEPRVATVKSDGELYKLLQQMLGELRQSHFNIIPPDAVTPESVKAPPNASIGVDVQVIDGQAVITRLDPASTGARAGLRPGFVIKRIDNTGVDQIFERLAKSKDSPAIKRLYMSRAVLGRIGGKADTSVLVQYLDEKDRLQEATIRRERLKGEMSPPFGNFPPQYTEFEAKRLANGIGYIRFNIFVTLLSDRIRAAIRSMSDAPGIILDLRGNPGGVGAMAPGIVGLLETKQTSLGTMKMRTGYQNFIAYPQPNAYQGAVAVLVDNGSASTSEILAAGIQEIGRAVIVGERSAGAALPSYFQKLPTGALFQFAIADFKTPKGIMIEGRGVTPDVEVKLSRKELLNNRDSQLEAAIEQVQKRTRLENSRGASKSAA